jgi:hypothetical protein
MIREIHNGLFAGLDSELSPAYTIQLLKVSVFVAMDIK